MFKSLLIAIFLLSVGSAKAASSNLQAFTVDWTARNANQAGTLLCDDGGSFDGVKVIVDGNKDSFSFNFTKGSDAKVMSIKEIRGRRGDVQTVIVIHSTDGFTMELEQDGSGATAEITEGDAC